MKSLRSIAIARLHSWFVRLAGTYALMVGVSLGLAMAESTMVETEGGGLTWQAGVNGVEIEFGPDGAVERVYSKYSHPVTIADRRGIHTANIIAEEKAKAEIIRFLEQEVASGRIVTEVEDTLSLVRQEDALTQSVDQRTILQNVSEFASSVAAGTLRGVVVLENGYDEDDQEAWVVVGVSRRTIDAAGSVEQMLNRSDEPAEGADRPRGGGATDMELLDRPPSRIRRGNRDF